MALCQAFNASLENSVFRVVMCPGLHVAGDLDPGIFQGGDIQRLADAGLGQDGGRNQFVGVHVGDDPAVVDDDDAVDIPVKDILQAVFDDDDGLFGVAGGSRR